MSATTPALEAEFNWTGRSVFAGPLISVVVWPGFTGLISSAVEPLTPGEVVAFTVKPVFCEISVASEAIVSVDLMVIVTGEPPLLESLKLSCPP